MGQPVIHFEVIGKDGAKLQSYYSELFGWEPQAVGGPMDYATVDREQNLNSDGIGIGGGIGGSSESDGHVTFYVQVDDAEAALAKAEELGGRRVHGPDEVPGVGIVIGHLADPEGHLVGVVQPIQSA
jgi:predicted enzyme related to lactoylglutathione lyase